MYIATMVPVFLDCPLVWGVLYWTVRSTFCTYVSMHLDIFSFKLLTFFHRLLKLSSPNLNYLIGAGAIIIYIDIYFFIVPATDPNTISILCNVRLFHCVHHIKFESCHLLFCVLMTLCRSILGWPPLDTHYVLAQLS